MLKRIEPQDAELATHAQRHLSDINVMVAGQGGDGSLTIITLLSQLLSRRGMYLYQTSDIASRIKGGHAAAMLRGSTVPRGGMGDQIIEITPQQRLTAGEHHHGLLAEPRDVVDQHLDLVGSELTVFTVQPRTGVEVTVLTRQVAAPRQVQRDDERGFDRGTHRPALIVHGLLVAALEHGGVHGFLALGEAFLGDLHRHLV